MKNDGSTKEAILSLIKVNGQLSVAQLAKQLDITEMGVRRHLHNLESESLIATKLMRQPLGRPLTVYVLTEQGEDQFPKHYKELLLEIVEELARQGNDEVIQKLMRRRYDKIIHAHFDELNRLSFPDRLKRIAEIQTAKGHMVSLEEKEDEYILTQSHCPISALASDQPIACQCESEMLKKLLRADSVEMVQSIAKGAIACQFKIKE